MFFAAFHLIRHQPHLVPAVNAERGMFSFGSTGESENWCFRLFPFARALEGRRNCHDNAVAESFFATFKKRVTKKKIYATRDQAKSEIFNFIEMFYNPIKRHSHTGGISPAQYEKDYFSRQGSV